MPQTILDINTSLSSDDKDNADLGQPLLTQTENEDDVYNNDTFDGQCLRLCVANV